VKRIAEAFGVSRSQLTAVLKGPTVSAAAAAQVPASDQDLVAEIKSLVAARATYGYRRVAAMLNRARREQGAKPINHKRVYRIMREHQLLLTRHAGKIRRPHDGQVSTLKSDVRWCSDMFQFNCWNGERVYVAFALDCCDREVISFVASNAVLDGSNVRDLIAQSVERRFGPGCIMAPHPLEFLSDNGPQYTAGKTQTFLREAGLLVRNTPAYSPESNGMAEAFVKTFKRDYVYVNDVPTADEAIEALECWFADYNRNHPHKALGMRSPTEFRINQLKKAA